MSKHKAIDIIQGQIDAREVSYKSYKDSAEYHAREAGDNLAKADKVQSDIAALESALADLRAHETISSLARGGNVTTADLLRFAESKKGIGR